MGTQWRRACSAVVWALAVVGALLCARGVHAKPAAPEYVKGEVLVKFKAGVRASEVSSVIASEGASVIKRYWINDVHRLKVQDTEAAIASLSKNPLVQYAEPNHIVHTLATPNDPSYSLLYGMNNTGQTGGTADADIDAPEAWDVTTGSSSVLVGDIDTGLDYNHPDLAANVWTNPGEVAGNGIDDDANGYVDDVHGINTITGSGDPMDDNEHGTHTAGTIGAVGNNGVGVVGVAWNVKILPCKFLNAGGSGSIADATECLQYTTSKGVRLTSNSWGGGGYDQSFQDALTAAETAGILFIAAAGNAASNNDAVANYPSNYPNANVIAVAATDHNDALASFSSYGATTVDVAAPGVNTYSTVPVSMGSYASLSGTSMATPHVSGLAALIWSQNPSLTAAQVKSRILLTTEAKPGLAGKVLTGGRINAYQALTANVSGPHIYFLSPSGGAVGDTVTLNGASFGATQGTGTVRFNGVAAAVTSWNDTSIVATVPSGLPTGVNAVTVTNPSGTSNSVDFNVLVAYYTQTLASPQFLGGGAAQTWRADDQCWSYTLPFTFTYFGTARSSVSVCSNGILDFGGSNTAYSNTDAGLIARPMVAALWDDLRTDSTAQAGEDIYVTASPTSVVFRWVGQTYSGSAPVNFETILDQDGSIRFNYGSVNTGLTPTVGISEGNALRHHLAPHNHAGTLTTAQSVVYTPIGNTCSDGDGDGYGSPGSAACPNGAATDCDDGNASVNPGAVEVPGNGLDDDCNPGTPDAVCSDGDADGYGSPGNAVCPNGAATDCDDGNASVNPGAVEVPGNGLDDDCNPGTPDAVCTDGDGDGYGNPGSAACPNGSATDCNDGNAAVSPGATEIPGNGVDDDCNAATPGGCARP
ncbi:MAG: S8 family serine peptidase [Deltaproteobacteria bacterium]|nr:S8 family serine peptidase [Deltaproteobacteria bacterium]